MQDNKAAYIAGMNSPIGSSPPSFSGTQQEQDQQQQSFQAAQDEKAYVEKAKGNQNENVQNYQFQTESYQNAPSPEAVAEATKKDPYDVLTREQEIEAGYPLTGLEKLYKGTGINIPNISLQALGVTAQGLQALFDKIVKPQISDFSNPNFLAVLDAAFKSGKLNKDEYTEKYKELIDDVYSGQAKENLEAGLGSLDSEGLFDLAMEEATANVEPGSSVQRITDPSEFYTGEQNLTSTGLPIMPAASGDLVNLASLDAQQFLSGENYNPKLAQMIFDARAQLDSMGKNPFTGNPQGGGGGQGIVAAAPELPFEKLPLPRPGPIVPDPTQPNLIMPTPLKPVGVAGLGNYPNFFPFLYNNAYTNRGLPSAYSNILSKYYGFA